MITLTTEQHRRLTRLGTMVCMARQALEEVAEQLRDTDDLEAHAHVLDRLAVDPGDTLEQGSVIGDLAALLDVIATRLAQDPETAPTKASALLRTAQADLTHTASPRLHRAHALIPTAADRELEAFAPGGDVFDLAAFQAGTGRDIHGTTGQPK